MTEENLIRSVYHMAPLENWVYNLILCAHPHGVCSRDHKGQQYKFQNHLEASLLAAVAVSLSQLMKHFRMGYTYRKAVVDRIRALSFELSTLAQVSYIFTAMSSATSPATTPSVFPSLTGY